MSARTMFLAALLATVGSGPAVQAAASARTVTIQTGDDMKFSLTEVQAKPGERLRIVLKSTGGMPKTLMGHNVVVLSKGADVKAFLDASAMARANDFVAPSFAKQILAATGLIGGGETSEVTFTAPKAPGRYDYVCSFPGHVVAGMRGVLVVK